MGYTTFRAVKDAMEDAAGGCDEQTLSDLVNGARHRFYLMYDEVALFLDAIECFRLQRFSAECNDCNDSFLGITLPREMQRPEAIWFNAWPIRIRSDWREWQTGISPECACGLECIDIPGSFSVAVDLACDAELEVVAFAPEDHGKEVIIRGVDTFGRPSEQRLILGNGIVTTGVKMKSIDRRGGFQKPTTKGRVMLRAKGGKMLAMYEPDETMPAYRRVKITGINDECESVNIRGSRRYFPLFGDDDVVESDNIPAFDAMIRYLRIFRKANKAPQDLVVEKDYLSTAKMMMLGEKSREQGKSVQAEVMIASPRFGARRLNRMQGGRGF